MAFCPNCQGVLEAAAVACPHCGYAFPPGNLDPRSSIAYSWLADLALVVGIVAAGLGCVVAVIASVVALMNGQWGTALVVVPWRSFYSWQCWSCSSACSGFDCGRSYRTNVGA
jgi:hypothetical protein